MLCLFEFLVGLALAKDGLRALAAATHSEAAGAALSVAEQTAVNVCANALIVLWTCWRFGSSLNIGPVQVLTRLGVHRPRFSWWAVLLVALHTAGVAIMVRGVQALMRALARWHGAGLPLTHRVLCCAALIGGDAVLQWAVALFVEQLLPQRDWPL